jgi:hypothetical protein
MFNGECDGEAVVNGVGGFGKDNGKEKDWDIEGVGGSFESGYGFMWFADKDRGAGGVE